MNSIIFHIFTTKHIGTREYAVGCLDVLRKYDLLPDKIGLFEPLKTIYSEEEAINMWITDGGTWPGYHAGNLIAKKKVPSFEFDVHWNLGERARVNIITVWFTIKSFKHLRKNVEGLFKDLITTSAAFHGYITDYDILHRQHVQGTITDRMDGIFWCNYFSEVYVNFFGRDKILSAPWSKIENIDKDKIITYLTEEPYDKELIESMQLEDKVKNYLGNDSFGDVEAWRKTFGGLPKDATQYRNVPKLDLSELQKSLD